MLLYPIYDAQQLWFKPLHLVAEATEMALRHPFCPLSYTEVGRLMALAAENLGRRVPLRRSRPDFDIKALSYRGVPLAITEEIVDETPFCKLIHFHRACEDLTLATRLQNDPKVLIVAPYDGHFATLLRDMVAELLPEHDVTITDWIDAKFIPTSEGDFGVEDMIDLLAQQMHALGPALHVIAPFDAGVMALAAVGLMADHKDRNEPLSLTLLGAPINARDSQSAFGYLAEKNTIDWFAQNMTQAVPLYYPGAFRAVHPSFAQESSCDALAASLTAFFGDDAKDHFQKLTRGVELTPQEKYRLYEDYLSVMDLPAAYYLQTIERVYKNFDLVRGAFKWHDRTVNLANIERTALLTIEAEQDHVTPTGQTTAAHKLCRSLPPSSRGMHLEIGIGHYGLIAGRQWRNNILPVIASFIQANQRR